MIKSGLYFAYGSNLLTARIEARLGACPAHGLAWLDGYSLQFHKRGRDGSGKGDAFHTASTTDRLYGALFEITSEQKHALDGFEGPGYRCEQVHAQTSEGVRHAWIYIAHDAEIDSTLIPFDWYQQLVEHGANEAGFPAPALQRIRTVPSKPDPDRARAELHFELIAGYLSR